MGKTKATRENMLMLCELYFLVKGKSTTRGLAEFLGVTPREARKYVKILKDRGILKDLGQVYELERLSDRVGKLLVGIMEKVINIREIREKLNDVYDLLHEALDYCYTEWGDPINLDTAYRINKALNILDEVLREL